MSGAAIGSIDARDYIIVGIASAGPRLAKRRSADLWTSGSLRERGGGNYWIWIQAPFGRLHTMPR